MWLLFALLLALLPNDWLIVPGERVGPVTATTVRADLPNYFAAGVIEEDAIELDEGLVQPATLISKNIPSESIAIVWSSKSPDAHPTQIFLCRGRRSGSCRWHTASGITDGIHLARLEELNARPFTINGFGLNYGGNVQSWDGGKLVALECGGKLSLTLDGDRRALTSEERHSIVGDKPVSSAAPAMRKVNPAVTEMVFAFGPPCSSIDARLP